jgi:hypothetical protein
MCHHEVDVVAAVVHRAVDQEPIDHGLAHAALRLGQQLRMHRTVLCPT